MIIMMMIGFDSNLVFLPSHVQDDFWIELTVSPNLRDQKNLGFLPDTGINNVLFLSSDKEEIEDAGKEPEQEYLLHSELDCSRTEANLMMVMMLMLMVLISTSTEVTIPSVPTSKRLFISACVAAAQGWLCACTNARAGEVETNSKLKLILKV